MKDIKYYEGLYAITEKGEVWSYRSNKFLKPEKTKTGYMRIELNINGKSSRYFIHRLVAETYIENPNNLSCVNHKDENKENNHKDNLEWCDYKYNNNYGNRIEKAAEAHRKPVKQLTMDGELIKVWSSATEASNFIGVQVYRAANGSRKSAGGYKWEYIEGGE